MTACLTLERLCTGTDPFLQPFHLEAGRRLERLVQRACLAPRLTMTYEAGAVVGRGGGNAAGDLTDSAADARGRLNRLAARLPEDCWGAVFDICGLGLGLQDVENRRQWPRRSAKLVLRIGLDCLAQEFGLAPHVAPDRSAGLTAWRDGRLPLIADKAP